MSLLYLPVASFAKSENPARVRKRRGLGNPINDYERDYECSAWANTWARKKFPQRNARHATGRPDMQRQKPGIRAGPLPLMTPNRGPRRGRTSVSRDGVA